MSSGESSRPTSNRRRLNRDPKIDPNIRKQYMPLLPEWDSQLPEVLEESVVVQAKVRAEDGRESVIDNI
ncbi:hypothetical protein GCK72_017370 [Caenorhabditis remanei]|uniref:Uncharacterized protein n=2 Tax=Caenorhabditis TaxID=6237 RepID=E3NCJ7_CAERE|nr:hypothetical protein GCK72_017370 [Caenorhabditis remanei]EFO92829.1 hypothetical protein CRE_18222 [Caenorhabditis remanei]KAF1750819.1 hypothetical protein GCK72_017370 [Caenorhabditis remanei]